MHIAFPCSISWCSWQMDSFRVCTPTDRQTGPRRRIPANTDRIPPEYHPKGGVNTTQSQQPRGANTTVLTRGVWNSSPSLHKWYAMGQMLCGVPARQWFRSRLARMVLVNLSFSPGCSNGFSQRCAQDAKLTAWGILHISQNPARRNM